MPKKKIVLLCLAALLLFTCMSTAVYATPVVNGNSELESGALVDDPLLTPQMNRKLKMETEAKEQSIAEPFYPSGCTCDSKKNQVSASCLVANSEYGNISISVTNYMQENGSYCGPASARQSLSFHKAKSGSATALPSQTTLASKIGTTTLGSTTTGIAKALNSYSGTFGSIYYVASDITDVSDPLGTFKVRIGAMVKNKQTAPIILASTGYLPRYNGHASRHYMTVSGLNDTASPVKMRTVDPNLNTSYYGVYWDAVGCTAVNGVFRACYEADRGGENKAMAW